MAKNLPYLISADYPGTDEEWKKTEEYKEILELKDFLDNNKSFNKNFPEYRELAKSIYALKMDIELGFNPLKGKCSCPPNVKIEENKS